MNSWKQTQRMLASLVGFALLAFIWQVVTVIWNPSPVVLPSPAATLSGLGTMVRSSQFWHDVGISVFRVLVGFVTASAMAIPLGIAVARSSLINDLLQPTLGTFRSVIPFAWIPLASLWFGLSETGKYFITWYAAFFVIAFQTEMAIRSVDKTLIKAGMTLGAGRGDLLLRVYLPAAGPTLLTGLRLGLAFAWISILAAELINSNAGIGYFTLNAAELFQTDFAFAAMIVIGIIGFLMDRIFSLIEHRTFAWYRTDAAQ
jgi:ABC-type nitrate/sulfonate/bicarbonate transport system permease component